MSNLKIFAIGCFASLCAVFVPRMLAMLHGDNANMQLFHINYIIVGLIFSFIIGGVTVIFAQADTKKAPEIFMTSLGIPALLAGALNTGTASNELRYSSSVNKSLMEAIQKQSGITEDAAGIKLLRTEPSARSQFEFPLIANAHAQDRKNASNSHVGFNLGIQVEQKPYVVVLEKSSNKADALQKAEALRKVAPRATVAQSNQDFLIIDNPEQRNKSDALLQAVDLKNKTNLKPYLLQVK